MPQSFEPVGKHETSANIRKKESAESKVKDLQVEFLIFLSLC